jgi:hypothetical protein
MIVYVYVCVCIREILLPEAAMNIQTGGSLY